MRAFVDVISLSILLDDIQTVPNHLKQFIAKDKRHARRKIISCSFHVADRGRSRTDCNTILRTCRIFDETEHNCAREEIDDGMFIRVDALSGNDACQLMSLST